MAHDPNRTLQRELSYHEQLYARFAQSHFARPAVRALRQHMADRVVRILGWNSTSLVLSLGCGVGDTELLLAKRVGHIVGMDLSPSGARQTKADAARLGIGNAEFVEGAFQEIRDLPPADGLIALDPSRHRLSGKVGRLLSPRLMKRYQTQDERELDPARR